MILRLAGLSVALCGVLAAAAEPAAPAPTSAPEQVAAPAQPVPAANPAASPTATENAPGAAAEPAKGKAEEPIIAPDHHTVEHVQVAHAAKPEEIASLLRIGNAHRDKGDYASAEIAFLQVLAERATLEQDHDALLGLARTYRKKGDHTKATAVYERFIKTFPTDPQLPDVLLEQGRSLRALGAYKQAIARFYSVLNSTLKLPDEGADHYRQLARTAQFEIAETHFQNGEYAEANRFFSRLNLLDLAPEDRARAQFKAVYALILGGDDEQAVGGLRLFISQNPRDENIPEARYLLSLALRRLGRTQESLAATLELLKAEHADSQSDPRRWAYWQRKTGNQLGNEFYEHGDFSSALTIYESLAQLSADPRWQLPVAYQTGLCYERLRRFDRARLCYQTIVDKIKSAPANGDVRPDLADLADMAAWRLSQLSWQSTTDTQLSAIFAPSSSPTVPPFSSPATASASDHDAHGRAPIASQLVR
ncbi:hypothetical protein DB347_16540 [Opitutaceae bacterium EW11]|nr:hypothetical protein DB347_16540 [Opitutaceae bacterium EW11]